MAEKSFARVGYKNALGDFIEKNIRAQDVVSITGESAEAHITNGAKHLTPEQAALISGAIQATEKGAANGVAPLGADKKIPAEYLGVTLTDCSIIVDDYAALLALTATDAPLRVTVLVEDSSGDDTVEEGWALYIRTAVNGDADDWLKLQEGEGLDIDFSQFIKNDEKGVANGVATLGGDGKVPNAQLKSATTSMTGIVRLNSATDSESEGEAATPKAVKETYELAAMLDAAYCTSEEDMKSKNLRPCAFVLMSVQNDTVDE